MQKIIKKIEAIGVYERFDIIQEFQPGINIFYAINGKGKTTFIHILANLLNGDYRRFLEIKFAYIKLWLNDNSYIEIIKEDDETIEIKAKGERRGKKLRKNYNEFTLDNSGKLIGEEALLPTAYFPSFRTMIDAWASVEEDNLIKENSQSEILNLESLNLKNNLQLRATKFARKVFGQFVPYLSYPSIMEIEQELSEKIQTAIINIARLDREVLAQSFIDIFAALSLNYSQTDSQLDLETANKVLEEIKLLSKNIQNYPLQQESISPKGFYSQLRQIIDSVKDYNTNSRQVIAVLAVYRDSLNQIFKTLEKSFAEIEHYISSVNYFLQDKQIIYGENLNFLNSLIQIRFEDGSLFDGLSALSSGERQILTLIYAATSMNKKYIVLIDEPEISLHLDWQRLLLQKMSEQLPNLQIITCTHSPMVGAEYEECLQELNLNKTNKKLWDKKEDSQDDEIEYLEDNYIEDNQIENFEIDITDHE